MNLPKIAVKRPVTVAMAMLVIIILGIISLTRLPIDLYPPMEIPVAAVMTSYPGTGPHEMEKLITKPIEEVLATLSNIDLIRSTSSQGNSVVVVQFKYGTDMDLVILEMRENIDLIKGALPGGSTAPRVLTLDPNAEPIIH